MKFYLVAIFATLICISVGNAAPSKSSTDFIDSLFNITDELPKYYECVINAMKSALTNNGEKEIWEKYGPSMLQHLKLWKDCSSDACYYKQSMETYSVITKCIMEMSLLDPDVMQEFAEISRKKCDP